ncbi:MAG: hypothetical protein QME77_12980, partial [bacterium]|nr:hypothetical protein [bacterium]
MPKKAQLLGELVGGVVREGVRRPPGRKASAKQQVSTSASQQAPYRRATYYLRPEQIKALKLRAVMEEKDLSGLVREAID